MKIIGDEYRVFSSDAWRLTVCCLKLEDGGLLTGECITPAWDESPQSAYFPLARQIAEEKLAQVENRA